jgi:hypothetical protein
VKVIQRAIRHYLYRKRPRTEDDEDDDGKPCHVSSSQHTKKHLQNLLQNEQNANLYKTRQDAAQTIIIVLREILQKSHLIRCKLVLR